MSSIPKLLIVLGCSLVAIGLVWHFVGRIIPLGRLPGDIVVEKENFKFYFPVVTCILFSLVISLISYLIRYFRGS